MDIHSLSEKEDGVVMIEAIIYLPLVIATCVFLIYVGLFKFQEAAFIYAIERTAQYGANEVAYAGYDAFGDKISTAINFDWSGGSPLDDADNIRAYYKASHENFFALYNEIFGSTWVSAEEISGEYGDVIKNAALLSIADGADYSVAIKRSLISTYVLVTVSYSIDTPGIMRYLGLESRYSYSRGACSVAINPAGFVRNVDLTVDVISKIAEKIGIDVPGITGKITEFLDKYY
ncbi:MAG: hypothetical protein IJR29_13420 [Butyrivibrio sp.]|nr:hypothetical protein [Butyrivibrio sp.]